MMEKSYWIYILHCENNSYYTGYTNDLLRRFQAHLDGSSGCKYTRSFKPIKIARSWHIVGSRGDAMKVERYLKRLAKKEKTEIILHPEILVQHFTEIKNFA